MHKSLIFIGLAIAMLLAMPLLVAARPGEDRVIVRTDDGRRIVLHGDDFTDEDWEEFGEAMEELSASLGAMFEDLDFEFDFNDDHYGSDRRGRHGHHGESFERLGDRMSQLGERLAERFDRFEGDDHGHWDDFGDRLSAQIERQVNQDVMERIHRDVAHAMDVATRDLDRYDFDADDLSEREARQVRRQIEREMRKLQREMERLQERLADLEDR